MTEKDYTFILSKKNKIRYNAGPYDKDNKTPKYEIEILIRKGLKSQIKINQFLMGQEGSYIWGWDLENTSNWPAFITIKKDGIIVKEI